MHDQLCTTSHARPAMHDQPCTTSHARPAMLIAFFLVLLSSVSAQVSEIGTPSSVAQTLQSQQDEIQSAEFILEYNFVKHVIFDDPAQAWNAAAHVVFSRLDKLIQRHPDQSFEIDDEKLQSQIQGKANEYNSTYLRPCFTQHVIVYGKDQLLITVFDDDKILQKRGIYGSSEVNMALVDGQCQVTVFDHNSYDRSMTPVFKHEKFFESGLETIQETSSQLSLYTLNKTELRGDAIEIDYSMTFDYARNSIPSFRIQKANANNGLVQYVSEFSYAYPESSENTLPSRIEEKSYSRNAFDGELKFERTFQYEVNVIHVNENITQADLNFEIPLDAVISFPHRGLTIKSDVETLTAFDLLSQ